MRVRLGLAALAAVALATAARAGEFRCTDQGDLVTVTAGDRNVLVYRGTPGPYKVYVKEVTTPGGVQVLLDSPADHVHHHALMYAVRADGVDFWGEDPGANPGKQTPRAKATARVTDQGGRRQATIEQLIDWTGPGGEPVLEERRHVVVHDVADATLLTWSSRLRPAKGRAAVRLAGPQHYVGLGLRFVRAMDTGGTFLNPTGKAGETVRGTEKLVRAPWCAYRATVDGKTVTVAMFDHPGNLRHPATWFTMAGPFAYLSATLNLHRQPRLLEAGRTLGLVYGVALWDGEVDAEAIEKAYQGWVALAPKPENPDPWAATHTNVARPAFGTKADASSVHGPEYVAAKALDGQWAVRETDKWNSADSITPHYLRLDLGQVRTIDRIRLVHEGILPDGDRFSTADFRLQRAEGPWGPWIDLVAPVYGNRLAVTEHVLAPARTRYLRLLIETGEQNDGNAYGRLFEIEVYSPNETLEPLPAKP